MFVILSVLNKTALYFQKKHDLIHIHIWLSNMIIIGFHLSFPFNHCMQIDEFILPEWIGINKKLQLHIFIKRTASPKIKPETITHTGTAKETANGPSMLHLTMLFGCRLSFFVLRKKTQNNLKKYLGKSCFLSKTRGHYTVFCSANTWNASVCKDQPTLAPCNRS